MKKVSPAILAQFAVLVAMEIVLSRFLSINTWSLKIGFAFVPVAVAGMLYGPVQAGIIAAAADLIGAMLFPSGPFFPGFTLTAFLGGVAYGLALHKKRGPLRIIAVVCVRELLLSLLLNTLWICILSSTDFFATLIAGVRMFQCFGMIPVQFVVISLVSNVIGRITAKRKV